MAKLISRKIVWQINSCIEDINFTFWKFLEHGALYALSIFDTINFLMYLAPSVCGIKGGADCPYNGHKNQWLFCYHYCKQKHFREGCKPPLQSLSDIPGKSWTLSIFRESDILQYWLHLEPKYIGFLPSITKSFWILKLTWMNWIPSYLSISWKSKLYFGWKN